MSNQSYRYNQINEASDQIRLINIIPRQGQKRIRLELETYSINEVEGQYEAVSYMWGSQSPARHVIIDGKTLRLRDNIWRCLKHLRDHGLTRSRLWIDTICINQDDDREKGQQVTKMRQIFQNASRVLIWLGSTSLQTYLLTAGSDTLRDSIETLPSDDCDSWLSVLCHSDSRSRSLENQIMSIVYNPFWQRLWIIQETALAREACIIFGKALLGKGYIRHLYFTARDNSKPGYRSWIARQRDPSIQNSGTALLDHHPMLHVRDDDDEILQDVDKRVPFGNLIQSYHWQGCTDPRDYVFGLVGLLESRSRFEIDYASSNEEVAVQALQYLNEEGIHECKFNLGFDIVAAAALLKALTVTSSTLLKATRTLPTARAETLQGNSFHLRFGPMTALTVDDSAQEAETEAYEYVSDAVKLLNGRIKQFTYVKTPPPDTDTGDSVQLKTKPGDWLLCSLHHWPVVMIRRSLIDDNTIKVEHFLWPDMTCTIHESLPWLEKRLPKNVREALEREINTCGIDWNNVCKGVSFDSYLQFSTLEIISLCELIVPKAADVAEFWRKSCNFQH